MNYCGIYYLAFNILRSSRCLTTTAELQKNISGNFLNWGLYKESYLHKRCLKHLFERHFDTCWLVSAAAQADRGLLLIIWRRITTENKTQKKLDWVEQATLTYLENTLHVYGGNKAGYILFLILTFNLTSVLSFVCFPTFNRLLMGFSHEKKN